MLRTLSSGKTFFIWYLTEYYMLLNKKVCNQKGKESRDADETQQQATLSSLSHSDRASTMQSHSKDTTQQATFPTL